MADVFDPALPAGHVRCAFRTMSAASRHTFQVFTKRPERIAETIYPLLRAQGEVWPNVWFIVSITNEAEADERIPALLRLRNLGPWPVLGVSVEPMLGPPGLFPSWLGQACGGLDWVIVGAQTGPGARLHKPEPIWVERIAEQCADAHVACFVKRSIPGSWPREFPDGHGRPLP